MRKFLVASGTGVLSLVLFGGVLVHKIDARRSATTCAAGPQESRARCTRLTVPKHKPKRKRIPGSPLPEGRCSRLEYTADKSGLLPNTPPTVELKASVDKITLSCKSGETPTVCTTDAKVQLKSVVFDADGDTPLLYIYSVTGGRISDGGVDTSEAVWDLSGLEAGSYTATVEVDDGCGCINSVGATVSVVACPDCNPQ